MSTWKSVGILFFGLWIFAIFVMWAQNYPHTATRIDPSPVMDPTASPVKINRQGPNLFDTWQTANDDYMACTHRTNNDYCACLPQMKKTVNAANKLQAAIHRGELGMPLEDGVKNTAEQQIILGVALSVECGVSDTFWN